MPLLKLETNNNSHYIQGNRSLTGHFGSLSGVWAPRDRNIYPPLRKPHP